MWERKKSVRERKKSKKETERYLERERDKESKIVTWRSSIDCLAGCIRDSATEFLSPDISSFIFSSEEEILKALNNKKNMFRYDEQILHEINII